MLLKVLIHVACIMYCTTQEAPFTLGCKPKMVAEEGFMGEDAYCGNHKHGYAMKSPT